MTKKVILYNSHQMGDLYHSRGLLNWIAENLNSDIELLFGHYRLQNTSLHPRIKKFLLDNSSSPPLSIPIGMNWAVNREQPIQLAGTIDDGNTLIINTWISSSPSFCRSVSCINAESLQKQTIEIIDIINSHFQQNIPYPSVLDVIPKLPSVLTNKKQADVLLNSVAGYRKKLLICNGVTHSRQTPNFNIEDKIQDLVIKNKDCAFIYTAKNKILNARNEYFINDYVTLLPNLDEVHYISTFCDVLVTRMSGPGCAICAWENFFNPNTAIVCLTDDRGLAHWYKGGVCKYDWTNDYSSESISSIISKYIGA